MHGLGSALIIYNWALHPTPLVDVLLLGTYTCILNSTRSDSECIRYCIVFNPLRGFSGIQNTI